MREIAEIELAIQGGTEKIETLGEQGQVEESMREMAAIEALKSEKADKEVSISLRNVDFVPHLSILARAPATYGHIWRVRTPKTPCLRRLRCLLVSARL